MINSSKVTCHFNLNSKQSIESFRIVNLIKHFPRMLYFLVPVLVALRVEGVEV